jgi:hypothetical protein
MRPDVPKSPPLEDRDRRRTPYGGWVFGVELVLAGLSALRLHDGGRGYLEHWIAFMVLVGSIVGALREFRRLL